MARFAQGDVVRLKSDNSIEGAVINVLEGSGEIRYQVFTGTMGIQTYYESQLVSKEIKSTLEQVDSARFNADLTASLIRNPSLSSLYSLNSARIDFIPHQFRPVLKFIKSDRPRLLIADGVGVGKTIEAGLILREMKARRNLESVLVICPRPLVTEQKWESEMERFDEEFDYLNGERFRYCIKEMDYEGEWPDKYKKAVLPYSLFDEANVVGGKAGKKAHLGLLQLDPPPKFDLVIVDEAHHIRNTATYAYQAVKQFCDNAEAVIFLTATPVQLEYDELFVMLNLLRPDLFIDKDTFHNMAEPNAYINHAAALVRAQKENWQSEAFDELKAACINTSWGRMVISKNPVALQAIKTLQKENISPEERVRLISDIEGLHTFSNIISRTRRRDIGQFTLRKATTVEVPFTAEQKVLHDSILNVIHEILSTIHCTENTKFMMTTIRRQVASCLFGLVPMLEDILYRHIEELVDDEYMNGAMLKGETEGRSIEHRIQDIIVLARNLPANDPKLNRLIQIVEDKQKQPNKRVMIFSSFKHTLRYLYRKLTEKGFRVGMIHGEVPDEERRQLRDRFESKPEKEEALDILLFSEVGCEGLDYQFCDTMINYDLPWNPMRIEQRIGRIDRRGQKSDTVKIYNMITEDTIDATIYDRCLSKIGVFEDSIGDCSEILGDISDQIMKIMFDPELTEEERNSKIEQMADNEVMKIQEMHRLEKDEKSLYGFDLSNYIQNKDVQDAENMWITPQSIQELVDTFMNDFLGEGEYLRGKADLKSLRLAGDKRRKLLDNLGEVKIVNTNNASKLWTAYLRSDKPVLPVTFDSVCAKDNRNAAFLTQMHPLVIQAAAYESNELPCEVGVTISTDELPAGDYEFLIYVWKYVGLKPDIRLVAVSDNEIVQKNILNYLQYSSEYEYEDNSHTSVWDSMDKLHYEKWQAAKAIYTKDIREECEYRLEQLRHSFNQRETVYRTMISNAEDERIIRMRQSQLDKLIADFEQQKKKLDDTVTRVDIRTNLQVKGILHVEEQAG